MDVLSSRTIIHPTDLEASLDFYGRALGLAVAREFGAGSRRGVVFFAGGGLVEVVGGGGSTASPEGIALWFQVRDLETSLAEVAGRGVAVARGAVLEPWGLREAWVDDPDGLRVHLVEVPSDHPLRRDQRPLTSDGPRP